MRVASSRNRLIYFRVSEEELDRFRSLAEKKGARSLSDLAREALERMHGTQNAESPAEYIPALLDRIHTLQDTVNRMHLRLEEIRSRVTPALNPSLQQELPDEVCSELTLEENTRK